MLVAINESRAIEGNSFPDRSVNGRRQLRHHPSPEVDYRDARERRNFALHENVARSRR